MKWTGLSYLTNKARQSLLHLKKVANKLPQVNNLKDCGTKIVNLKIGKLKISELSLHQFKQRRENIYRESLFICLGHLAKQDGRVSPQEIAAAERIIKHLELNFQERQQAVQWFNQGKLTSCLVEPYLQKLKKTYALQRRRRLALLDYCLQMIYADGGPKEQQWQRIQDFIRLVDIRVAEFKQLHQRLLDAYEERQRQQENTNQQQDNFSRQTYQEITLIAAYKLLSLTPEASNQEVKYTYRRLMSQNHPDKLMAQGLSQAALERAKERTQDIQQAYALLKKERNIK